MYRAVRLASGGGGVLGFGARLPVRLPFSAYATVKGTGDVRLDRFKNEYYAAQDAVRDEMDLTTLFERWGLIERVDGSLFLTWTGALLFGPTDRLPTGMHTDVQVRVESGGILSLYGLPMVMAYAKLSRLLSRLWEDSWEDPSRRDEAGRPLAFASYPRTALTEALVNFVIHRDYVEGDMAYVNILDDRVEMKNPGASPRSEEELLSYQEPLQLPPDRNALAIRVFSRTRLNQRQGGGILRIRRALVENGNVTGDGDPALSIDNDPVGNRFTITIYRCPPPQALSEATGHYLQPLADRYRYR